MSYDQSWGDALLSDLPLDDLGAPGFTLRQRVDFSGHHTGLVTPHVNADVIGPCGNSLCRDLANTQVPGFNGMQATRED